MSYSWILIAASLASAASQRIPNIYEIEKYELELTIPQETLLTETSNNFSGLVSIEFRVTEPTNVVTLHANSKYLNIQTVSLGNPDPTFSVDDTTDILTINMATDTGLQRNDSNILVIGFSGRLSTDMTGFYKSSYLDSQKTTHYILSTQFQPTFARNAFPCFDEPSFKSKFEISINVPLGFQALSNSPITSPTTKDTFQPTPSMSTYLLAFTIHDADFTCTSAISDRALTHQVCSRKDEAENRALALQASVKLLNALDVYTQIPLSGLGKLDHLAIPDISTGASENWGLVKYREDLLLWNSMESSNLFKQYVITTIAHELAHFWFGNLVTLSSWTDTYLSKGIATYFEYFITDQAYPEFQMNKQFVTSVLQEALLEDSQISSVALSSIAETPAQIAAKFGKISYLKGAAIFRMLEHIVEPTNFQTGIRSYLQQNLNGRFNFENLLTSFGSVTTLPDGINLSNIMANWIERAGYPILYVTVENNRAIIRQERFLLNGHDSTTWYVPITFTTSLENAFTATKPSIWLTPSAELNLTLPDNTTWIMLNNQQTGFYRVNYDETTWHRIGQVLASQNHGGIPDISRAQMVDDLFNLARANKVSYRTLFEIIRFLQSDTSYLVWKSAFSGFNYMLDMIGPETIVGRLVSEHILMLMRDLYGSTKFTSLEESDQLNTLRQTASLTMACRLKEEECTSSAKALLLAYRINRVRPNRNIRNIAYCYALRDGTNEDDWNFLWQSYLDTTIPSEKTTILRSLGCTTNQNLLNRYLNESISSKVRPQDRDLIFSYVLARSSVGFETAVEFFKKNHHDIRTSYQSMNAITNILNEISSRITSHRHYNQFKHILAELVPDDITNRLAPAEANLKWKLENEGEIVLYFLRAPSKSSSFGVSILAISTMLFSLIFNIYLSDVSTF